MNPPLNPGYHDTVFQYNPTGTPTEFWVVTAYNPDGRNTDPATNSAADEKLRSEITGFGITPFRVIGMSPDGAHAEPGWGFPCDETTAIGIGRRFSQEAVFHFIAERIDLVNCLTLERHPLTSPADRLNALKNGARIIVD